MIKKYKQAEEFNNQHHAKVAYRTYQEVFEDDNIDIVYIGKPMSSHYQNMLDILEQGKHILCEKRFILNTKDTKDIKRNASKKIHT